MVAVRGGFKLVTGGTGARLGVEAGLISFAPGLSIQLGQSRGCVATLLQINWVITRGWCYSGLPALMFFS